MKILYDWLSIIIVIFVMLILVSYRIYNNNEQLKNKTIEINNLCGTNLTIQQVKLLGNSIDITECAVINGRIH